VITLLVGTPDLSAVTWFIAAIPVITLLVLMVGFNWGGAKAGGVAWLSAIGAAWLGFGAGPELIAYSQTKGILLALWVLYIIWAALFLFHVVSEAGGIRIIGDALVRVTSDRVLQLMILAWCFTGFLQGFAGFGVPVAIVAPLMAGIGFSPVVAVVATLIGHTWAVTFGSLGASFFAIVGVTGQQPEDLASPLALMLGAAVFLAGAASVWSFRGPSAVIRMAPLILIVGGVMAGVQWVMAVSGFYTLAAFTAGITGMVVMILLVRSGLFNRTNANPESEDATAFDNPEAMNWPRFLLAVHAYALLVFIVLSVNMIDAVGDFLGRISIDPSFPETATDYGWTNPATDSYRSIDVFSHPGALLLYTAVIGLFIYRRAGLYDEGAIGRIWRNAVDASVSASLGIVTLVGMALVMMDSGMTYLLAQGIAEVAGGAFPALSPFIGVLGAFMTGSNTNSNILFGALQLNTALILELNVGLILAAQTTGGALGSIIAPAKIIVGCSTVGLAGREGPVVRTGIKFGLAITAIIGLITIIASLALGSGS
jgi:lactate permease